MRHQVEDVFFHIGRGGGNPVDLALADHFGEGDAELARAHGAGDGNHHFSAAIEVLFITLGRVESFAGVEMFEIGLQKL